MWACLSHLKPWKSFVAQWRTLTHRSVVQWGDKFSFTTRHGSNDFHGAVYEYHQDAALDANTWTRNFLGQPRAGLIDNRFGARLGGPIIKDKTFFFGFYEGRRFPNHSDTERLVPSNTFRQGILQFPDATGNIVNYNIRTSTLCGPSNNSPCDPRGIGMSPIISQLMQHYPLGNSPSDGDGLNYFGFRGPANTPITDDFGLFRLDHNFNQKWHFNGSFLWSRERILSNDEVEIDPTITKGEAFKTLAGYPNDGRVANAELTTQISPTLFNDFHAGWTQTGIPLIRQLPRIQIPAAGAPLALAVGSGYSGALLASPGDPQVGLGPQSPDVERDWHFIDNVNWLKGLHSIQTGFNYTRGRFLHTRFDKGPYTTVPVGWVTADSFTTIPASQRPPTCSGSSQTNCLVSGTETNWDLLYAAMIGMIDNVTYFVPRNAQGSLLPPGSGNASDSRWNHVEFYGTDTFRFRPSITVTYGINFGIDTPEKEANGRQGFMIDNTTGQPIIPAKWLAAKQAAALQGQTYNPQIAFAPVSQFHRGVYPTAYEPAPRIAIAWNPDVSRGLLGRIFGERKTVLRGGYGLQYSRINMVNPVEDALEGLEELGSTYTRQAPFNAAGQPYRVGVDGPVPIPPPQAQILFPYVTPTRTCPTFDFTQCTAIGITDSQNFDPNYHVGHVHSVNMSLQRSLPHDVVVEVGGIGRYGRGLPEGLNLNAVPVFIKDTSGKSNQTFAQAFDAVATQLRAGAPATSVKPQPWFENEFGPFLDSANCAGFATATACFAGLDSADFINNGVGTLFKTYIDPAFMAMGASPVLNQQFSSMLMGSYGAWSNYNALFVSVRKRTSNGLSLTVNYTYAHSLDTGGSVQDNWGGVATDPYNLNFDYGDAITDRRHSLTGYGTWEVPWMKKSKVLGGWYFSGIFSAYTGLPLMVTDGEDLFGSTQSSDTESVPITTGVKPSVGVYRHVTGSNGVATSGDPATGGTGLNIFANPAAVFNSLRPFLLSQDTRSWRGWIREPGWWNFDMTVGKTFSVTERWKVRFNMDFFNLFNHPVFQDPQGCYNCMSLQDPADFGVLTTQAGNPGVGDFAGPRRIQAGLRVEF